MMMSLRFFKALLLVTLWLLLCALDVEKKTSIVVYDVMKYSDWQKREKLCANVGLTYSILLDFEYESEKGDYWKTSCEAALDRKGDCEDFAALALRVVGGYGKKVWLFATPTGFYHAVLNVNGMFLEMNGFTSLQHYIDRGYEPYAQYDVNSYELFPVIK
jgi:hypothetical protein